MITAFTFSNTGVRQVQLIFNKNKDSIGLLMFTNPDSSLIALLSVLN